MSSNPGGINQLCPWANSVLTASTVEQGQQYRRATDECRNGEFCATDTAVFSCPAQKLSYFKNSPTMLPLSNLSVLFYGLLSLLLSKCTCNFSGCSRALCLGLIFGFYWPATFCPSWPLFLILFQSKYISQLFGCRKGWLILLCPHLPVQTHTNM